MLLGRVKLHFIEPPNRQYWMNSIFRYEHFTMYSIGPFRLFVFKQKPPKGQ